MRDKIDIADRVHHGPSNENWIVAAVTADSIYWCGYPFGGCAELSDCTLIKKATPDEKDKLIRELSIMSGDEYPIAHAREILEGVK